MYRKSCLREIFREVHFEKRTFANTLFIFFFALQDNNANPRTVTIMWIRLVPRPWCYTYLVRHTWDVPTYQVPILLSLMLGDIGLKFISLWVLYSVFYYLLRSIYFVLLILSFSFSYFRCVFIFSLSWTSSHIGPGRSWAFRPQYAGIALLVVSNLIYVPQSRCIISVSWFVNTELVTYYYYCCRMRN